MKEKLFALVLLIGPQPTYAQGLTGNELLYWCEQPDTLLCQTYIAGVFEGISTQIALELRHQSREAGTRPSFEVYQEFHKSRTLSCASESVTSEQTILVIVKYLRDNPATLHLTAGQLIVSALSEAFPCN